MKLSHPWFHLLRLSLLLLPATAVRPTPVHAAAPPETPANLYAPYPPVVTPAEGISWPQGQALPIFATPADTLDTLDVQGLTTEEQVTFSALQGQVNRSRPRILLIDSRTDEGRDTWAETPTLGLGERRVFSREDRYQLLAKYATEVAGVVLYDTRLSPHYQNLAGTVAGIRKALPVTRAVLAQLLEHAIDLPVLEDLTTLQLTTPIEIYEHLHAHYWPACEKRLIISSRPDRRGGDHHHTRDLAAAVGAAVVWLDNRIPEERAVMRKFFGDMKAGEAIALGWYTTERSGITTASEFGIGTLPADHFISATVHSGVDHTIRIPAVPKKPALQNKAYIAIFVSDGDNIQYTQRAMRKLWDASAAIRGAVPISWTIAPGLVDIAPGILNYYYDTATPNDCFVTGPSGMGYAMPFNTLTEPGAPVGLYLEDESRMEGYARLTETYLQRSGLRIVTVWDQLTPMQRAVYTRVCRTLYGVTVQNFKDVPSVQSSIEEGRLRFEKLIIPYVGTYEHIQRSIRGELRRWDRQSPLFLAYQGSVWEELKPARIVELERSLTEAFPGLVEFVRADHYFNLFNEAHDLPFNLAMAATTGAVGGATAAPANAAIDGTPSTLWSHKGPKAEQWLQLDLGATYPIRRCVIRHAGASGASRSHNTRDFTLLAGTDGNVWQTVAVVRGNSENATDFEWPDGTIQARFLKLLIEDPGTEDDTARIADIEVYGTAAQACSPLTGGLGAS
ncbi:MAG: GxGYxYP family putative glycoside hydrolase [Verrucomicrobiota bacterium]|nr:GxGYxYP family putative glycoside hydrolase [Verrucomicrobiota bacterium]